MPNRQATKETVPDKGVPAHFSVPFLATTSVPATSNVTFGAGRSPGPVQNSQGQPQDQVPQVQPSGTAKLSGKGPEGPDGPGTSKTEKPFNQVLFLN